MDPYLEDPALWPDVHHRLIAELQTELNLLLRPKYYARVEERVYIADDSDTVAKVVIPDLRIAERPGAFEEWKPGTAPGGTAVVEVAEPIEVVFLDEEIHESRLEVLDRESRKVVTVLEVVSPTNKVLGSRGRESYLEKRREILASDSHWVEIDLLREGTPVALIEGVVRSDYTVYLSRVQRRPRYTVWPIQLYQKLPAIFIPLKGDDPDVHLDLQKVLTSAYERAGYDLMVDYRKDPIPPLPPERREWAEALLHARGQRP
jgi:hypothetical protein